MFGVLLLLLISDAVSLVSMETRRCSDSQNKSSSHTTKTSLVEPPSADIISASVFSTIDSENISMVSHMPASLLHAAASAVNSSDSIPPVT